MKICLDAGHYGKYNQSPTDKNYYESDMVRKLTELQKKYLEVYGIEVITTRTNQAGSRLCSRSIGADNCVETHNYYDKQGGQLRLPCFIMYKKTNC